jgi:PAS domain S-box-containing protein
MAKQPPILPTESRQYLDVRRESEEHLRHLVEGVQDYAILLLDPGGRIASWNAGAERIKGYKETEVLGKHFSLFYTPDAVANGVPERGLRVAASEGRFADEGWRVRKDGSRFWASIVITAIRDADGTLRAFFKITRDLTERWQADEALRLSEERFRLLVECVLDYAIFVLTPEGNVATWNRGAQRMKGYESSEILGRHFSTFYPPDALAQGKPEWELEQAIEYGRVEDEGWRIRKDGTRFWANVVITALREKDGRLVGFAKVTRDLTQRRRIEELQEADHKKNQFLAMLSHELRNPLAPIRTALQILKAPEATADVIAKARTIAEHQVGHMSRLLDDLIDVSRIAEDGLELRKEVVDIPSVVRSAVERTQSFIADRRHALTVDVSGDPLFVLGDRARLEQVLTNLLNNSAKYTDPGGRIRVSAGREGSEVVVRVKDSGIGMDAVVVPRIFDLFVQAERRLDRSLGGVGVGLTLVKELVEKHGGTVEARSAGLGKGSEFIVRLPSAEGVRVAPASQPETSWQRAEDIPLRILVADDNADAADSLAMLLEMRGDAVRVAYDGVAVLTEAETFRPHVALLDIGMPGMDGYEVARRLRAAPGTKGILLVAASGWGTEEDRKMSREAGFDHHLVKPFDLASLEKLLHSYKASAR